MTSKIVLKRNRKKRLEAGHPWIFQSEVDHIEGECRIGDIVDIVNHNGLFLARAYANPEAQLTARVLTFVKQEAIDTAFFARRFKRAKDYRTRFLGEQSDACRMVYGEADFLPGLIVDRYGKILVVQILSAGMEKLKPVMLPALVDVFSPTGIYLRNDVPIRTLDQLSQETGVWYGSVPRTVDITENGLRYRVDLHEGQKTGYFFDQRENRASIAPLVQGAEVLECFCHTGSFTANALKYGAKHVTAVDISESAIEAAKVNMQLNGFEHQVHFEVANVFDYLRNPAHKDKQFDVVILDPPAFAKTKRAVEGAIRGYKEINLRGMKLVKDGGFLVTSSCSFHMWPQMFNDTILDAAFDAHKVLRLVQFTGAGKDHPEIAGVDEAHYLKFAIYEVNSRA